MSHQPQDAVVVGWREVAALPEWGIKRLKAKIDTGARTSALHVGNLEEMPDGRVRFEVIIREAPRLKTRIVEATPIRVSTVKSSQGEVQERLVFRTRLVIGPISQEIELSLVSRTGMLCRMLVGRLALPDDVLVDPSKKYIHGGVRIRKPDQGDLA